MDGAGARHRIDTLGDMNHRTWTSLVLSALAALLGACTYEIRGRVVEDAFDSVAIVSATDERLDGANGLTGARIVLTRDPGSLNRRDVASAVTDGSGWFTLRLDEFGSGWMEEQWAIRIARTGFSGTEDLITLPSDPSRSRLLVTLAPGPARRGPERGSSAQIADDLRRYGSSPTGRSP